jgi:hypothetical protein
MNTCEKLFIDGKKLIFSVQTLVNLYCERSFNTVYCKYEI